jgi:septum formation protein
LSQAGYKFEVVPSDVDEADFPLQGISPCKYAERLALAKAMDVAEDFRDKLVLGADTIVDFDGRIIGKPTDAEDAERITKMLFSMPHKVITAVAIVRLEDGVELIESDTTVVYPRKLSSQQIADHITSGTWQDKAGAYAIQENGDEFIEKINGSMTNVMGLPMELVQRMFAEIET